MSSVKCGIGCPEATAFKIKTFEANDWLLWEKPDSTWAWRLIPLEDSRTRLVSRLKGRYAWRESIGGALSSLVLLEFADFPMIRRLLLNVKLRAERTPTAHALAGRSSPSRKGGGGLHRSGCRMTRSRVLERL